LLHHSKISRAVAKLGIALASGENRAMRTTTQKGDIAILEATTDLTKKGYTVLRPVTAEDLGYDLVIEKDVNFQRVQVKYSQNGQIHRRKRSGKTTRDYDKRDADIFAVYLPEPDVVIYLPISFIGHQIRWTLTNTSTRFWWYEDFLDLPRQEPQTRNSKELKRNHKVTRKRPIMVPNEDLPPRGELKSQIWTMPMIRVGELYGVSDNAVRKWAKKLRIKLPRQGFWAKTKNRKHIGRSPSGYGT